MTKIIVTGAAGRMGRRIIALAQETDGVELVGAVERLESPALGRDAGEIAGIGRLGVTVQSSIEPLLPGADAVIDFSLPAGTLAILPYLSRAGRAAVIGTTGFSEKEIGLIRKESGRIPCVLSPNMSVGVNLLFRLLAEAARITRGDYDIEITEMHHRHKKDAPSGTALRMAQVLAEALGRDLNQVGVYSRHGTTGERRAEEIGIQSLRGGDVVGEHTVIFAGPGERIELTHRAHSRDNFARGAILAAVWAAGKKPGLYDMADVLGLNNP